MGKRIAFMLAAALAATGCLRAQPRHVEGGVLGRVVIYRNGVAFYERRAEVIDGTVSVNVPRERVDDFLKSLTVVDPATGKPLAVTIPRQQATDGSYLTMTLETGNRERAQVLLTYVTESPAWKPSYRAVLGNTGKVLLEAWAIVDNTTSEDWRDVLVGVGASSALAFRYDLWSVRQVDRDLLEGEDRFAIAPPQGVSPYSTEGGEELAQLGTDEVRQVDPKSTAQGVVVTKDYVKNVSVPGRTFEATLGAAAGTQGESLGVSFSGSSTLENQYVVDGVNTTGSYEEPPPAPPPIQTGDEKIQQIVAKVRETGRHVLVEVSGPLGTDQEAAARGNQVRNSLVDAGIPIGKIHVVSNLGADRGTGVRILAVRGGAAAEGRVRDLGDDVPVGESRVFAERPMNVGAGTSAMVSMMRQETPGAVAYLFDPISDRGDTRYAFRSIRIENPSDDSLEPGPLTVYGEGRFIGEGITDAVPPHATVVVPFALDKQIVVEREGAIGDSIAKLITAQRGVITAELQRKREVTYHITSRLPTPATVYLRHRLESGWTLTESPGEALSVGDSKLFEVSLGAGATIHVTIAEATPIERTFELTSEKTLGMMRVYLEEHSGSPALEAAVKEILATHAEIAELDDRLETLRGQLAEYRDRSDELTAQIVALRAVKTGGKLLATLKGKLGEMSSRTQTATIDLVDAQEQQMLARVTLQNQLAELRLPDATGYTKR